MLCSGSKLALAATFGLVLSAFPASAGTIDSFTVYVGHADNLRTNGRHHHFTQTHGYNFDSSDQGLFGGVPPANLDPNNAAGNGNTNLIGFILNSGGYGFVNNSVFGEDGNESINWNTVGGNQRGGSAPEPGTLLTMAGPLAVLAFLLRKRLLSRPS